MSTIRGVKDRRFKFTQILNTTFEDPDLSLKAKGFIGYCLTKPENWQFHVTHLCKVLKEGEKAIYSVINECIQLGYGYRYQPRKPCGDLLPVETIISDSKEEIETIKKEIENHPDFKKCLPLRPFGEAIKSGAINGEAPTYISNTDSSNTDSSNTEEKQQQPPTPKGGAVAVLSTNEIYECLKDVDIPDKLKKDFTRENSQEVVQNAIKNLMQQTDIQCTAAYLTSAIKNKWKPKELPEDLSEKNKITAKKYDQKENAYVKIECLDKSVEFVLKGVQSDPIVLNYDSKGFEENFRKTIDKYKLA
jgi:phage pi2 protein 07